MNTRFLRTSPLLRLQPRRALARPVAQRLAHHASPVPPSAPKAKPNKSPSSLKRTASASLPIRANPTPTRGAIKPVYTFATAERYDLTRVRHSLPAGAVRFEDAWWAPLLPEDGHGSGGEAWAFKNGTVVVWGLDEEASRKFVEDLVHHARSAQISPLKVVETEELEFVIDPAECVQIPPFPGPSLLILTPSYL